MKFKSLNPTIEQLKNECLKNEYKNLKKIYNIEASFEEFKNSITKPEDYNLKFNKLNYYKSKSKFYNNKKI